MSAPAPGANMRRSTTRARGTLAFPAAALLGALLSPAVRAEPAGAPEPSAPAATPVAPASPAEAPAPAPSTSPPEPPTEAPVPAEPAPGVVPVAPLPVEREAEPVAPAEPSASRDDARALAVLDVFAERERALRTYGGYASLIGGAAAVTGGLIADYDYDRSYGRPIWILGVVMSVGGLVGLLATGPVEALANDAALRPAAELRIEWAARARAAESARYVGGGIALGLGAVGVGTGAAIAAGAGDLEEVPKQDWSVALIVIGGGVMGSALAQFFIESEIEAGYRAAYGADPDHPPLVSFGVVPASGGGMLGLTGNF